MDIPMSHVATASPQRLARHSTTVLAWAFTIYMIQGYLLVPFHRFESALQDVCEAARAETEEIGGAHEGCTIVVSERCETSEKERATEAKAHDPVESL
jgi:hypothetical protein